MKHPIRNFCAALLLGAIPATIASAASVHLSFPGTGLPSHKIERLANGDLSITFEAAARPSISATDLVYEMKSTDAGTRVIVSTANRPWSLETNGEKGSLTVSVAASPPAPVAGAMKAETAEVKLTSSTTPVLVDKLASGTAEVKAVIANYSLDLSIPDSPGLAILGLGTEDVAHPTTPRALAAAIHNGIDKDGKVKTGLALDFAPYKVLAPQTSTADYRDSRLLRLLWNTQVSIGTAKPMEQADKSLTAGIGLHSIIYRPESSDPLLRMEHLRCLDEALLKVPRTPVRPGGTLGGGGRTDEVAGVAAAQECYKTLAADTWNGTAVALSLATSRFSETGKWSGGKKAARGGWVTASYGFEHLGDSPLRRNAQGIVTYRRLLDEKVADPLDDKALVSQNSRLLGGKLRWRGNERNFFVESTYQRIHIAGRDEDRVRRLAVGLEWKLAESVWLVAALGGEGGRKNGNDTSFVMTGLKFGSSSESLLGK